MGQVNFAILLLFCVAASTASAAEDYWRSFQKRADESFNKMPAPYVHAARAPGDDINASRQRINAWIRYNMEHAFNSIKDGDMNKAIFFLSYARHAMRDAVSPAFNDAQGNPAELTPGAPIVHHELAQHKWADKVDEDLNYMFEHQYVPGGDLLLMYGIDTPSGPVDRPHQTAPFKKPQAATDQQPATLSISKSNGFFRLAVPVSKLTLSIPDSGITVASKTETNSFGGSANHPRYFHLVDKSRGLVISGWFESASHFRGTTAAWEAECAEWKKQGLPEPVDVSFEKLDGWEAVFYENVLPIGAISHVRAYFVKDGTWIDVHVSLAGGKPGESKRNAVRDFLKSLQVTTKSDG